MVTFAEHAAALMPTGTALASKQVRANLADHLASVFDVPVHKAPQAAPEMPCGMIFAGGNRDYREQTGFEAQTIRWTIVFMTTGDEEDVADWFDDILDSFATHLMDVNTGSGNSVLSLERIREPIEATTGSTQVMALRIEVSMIRSSC